MISRFHISTTGPRQSIEVWSGTPDFFGYNADRELKYRGPLEEGRTTRPHGGPRELVEAMRAIATTGVAPADQKPSIGCSIKWRTNKAEPCPKRATG